ncbi:tetratricopeptide repeat protein, partial [Deinococcus pimensis]|uniref:tetratricopeptide repeat protein n=1 Tax=Deinococcus pimensis TaxID=309888 RepID=UPI0012F932E1
MESARVTAYHPGEDVRPPHLVVGEDARALLDEATALLGTDPARALELARTALRLAGSGLPDEEGAALLLAGQALARLARPEEATDVLTRAVGSLRRLDPAREVEALHALARLHLDSGELDRAAMRLAEALERCTRAEDKLREARTFNLLARVSHAHGEPTVTLRHLQRAIDLFRELGDRVGESDGLTNLGRTLTDLGHYPEALERLLEAYTLVRAHRSEDARIQGILLFNIGVLQQEMDRLEEADASLREALVRFEAGGHAHETSAVQARLAEVLLRLRRPGEAEEHASAAVRNARHHQLRSTEGSALVALAQVQAALERWEEARDTYEEAVAVAGGIDDQGTLLDAHMGAARAYLVR